MQGFGAACFTIAVVLVVVASVFFLPVVLVGFIDDILNKHRRKKYPEYFEYWDKALELSFKRAEEYRPRKEYFDYKFKLYTEGLRDGECTNEFFVEKMNILMDEYKELCSWFQVKEKEIKELLVKADLYAKEHDLIWGIIYDSKST